MCHFMCFGWKDGCYLRYFGPDGGEALVSCRRCIIIGVKIQVLQDGEQKP